MVRKRREPTPEPEPSISGGFIQHGHDSPRVEVPRADGLHVGTPAPAKPAPPRDATGKLLPGPETSLFASQGGKAAHEARQLRRLLGLWQPAESDAYYDYYRLACEWRDSHLSALAANVGAGEVGPGPASLVSSAAIQLGASRYLSDLGARTSDAKLLSLGSKLANDSRQNLLAAHELCVRETDARLKADPSGNGWPWPFAGKGSNGKGQAAQ